VLDTPSISGFRG